MACLSETVEAALRETLETLRERGVTPTLLNVLAHITDSTSSEASTPAADRQAAFWEAVWSLLTQRPIAGGEVEILTGETVV